MMVPIEVGVVFSKYDVDGSGKLDSNELYDLCEELGYPLTNEEINSALQTLDTNRNGLIDQHEFLQWWNSESTEMTKKLKQILQQVKADNHLDIHRYVFILFLFNSSSSARFGTTTSHYSNDFLSKTQRYSSLLTPISSC